MEPRKLEKPSEPRSEGRSEGQTSPPRQSARERRFQILKLEERIAPRRNHARGQNRCYFGCYY